MKSFERREKVARALKIEIGNLIQKGGVKDDRLNRFISIVDVSLNPGLSSAKVFFSILTQSEDEEMTGLEMSSTKAALNDNAGSIRGIVGRKLNLRYAPKIYFIESESLSKSVDMVDLIDRTVNHDDELKKGIE
jgi:ribosome-binding factor A